MWRPIDSRSADLYFGRSQQPYHPNFVSETQALRHGPDTLIIVREERENDYRGSVLGARTKRLITIGRTSVYGMIASG